MTEACLGEASSSDHATEPHTSRRATPCPAADDAVSNGLSEQEVEAQPGNNEWRFLIPLLRGAAQAEAFKRADGRLVFRKSDGTERVMGEDTPQGPDQGFDSQSNVSGSPLGTALPAAPPSIPAVSAAAAEVATTFSRSHSGRLRSSTPRGGKQQAGEQGGASQGSSHTPPRPRHSMSRGGGDANLGWPCAGCGFVNWFSKKRSTCKKCGAGKPAPPSEPEGVDAPQQQQQAQAQAEPDAGASVQAPPPAQQQGSAPPRLAKSASAGRRIFAKANEAAQPEADLGSAAKIEKRAAPAKMGIAAMGLGGVGGMGIGGMGVGGMGGMGIGGVGGVGGMGVAGFGIGKPHASHRKGKRHGGEKLSLRGPRHGQGMAINTVPPTAVPAPAAAEQGKRPSAPPSPQGNEEKEKPRQDDAPPAKHNADARRSLPLFNESGVRKIIQSINQSLQAGMRNGVLPVATVTPPDTHHPLNVNVDTRRPPPERQSRREKKFLKKAEQNYQLEWDDLKVDWDTKLGQGAYGKVYKCWKKGCGDRPRTGDLSALKEMKINEMGCREELMSMSLAAESELAAWERITNTVSMISKKKELKGYHHIVTPYKPFFHEKDSKLFLLMEFMHFGSLDDLLICLSRVSREVSDAWIDTIMGYDAVQRMINAERPSGLPGTPTAPTSPPLGSPPAGGATHCAPLRELILAYVLDEVLCGLNFLHSMDMVHQDIKPGNILINNWAQVKIGDFGLTGVGEKGVQGGTRLYMSPERLLGDTTTGSGKEALAKKQKADIWSVGVMALESALGLHSNSAVHLFQCSVTSSRMRSVEFDPRLLSSVNLHLDRLDATHDEKLRGGFSWEAVVRSVTDHPELHRTFSRLSDSFVDFCENCLKFSPDERPPASRLRQHLFIDNNKGDNHRNSWGQKQMKRYLDFLVQRLLMQETHAGKSSDERRKWEHRGWESAQAGTSPFSAQSTQSTHSSNITSGSRKHHRHAWYGNFKHHHNRGRGGNLHAPGPGAPHHHSQAQGQTAAKQGTSQQQQQQQPQPQPQAQQQQQQGQGQRETHEDAQERANNPTNRQKRFHSKGFRPRHYPGGEGKPHVGDGAPDSRRNSAVLRDPPVCQPFDDAGVPRAPHGAAEQRADSPAVPPPTRLRQSPGRCESPRPASLGRRKTEPAIATCVPSQPV